MLFFNKLLPVFVLPTGLIALLVFFALWRKKRWPGVLALGVLYLSSIPAVGNRLIGWVETRYPPIPENDAHRQARLGILGPLAGIVHRQPGRHILRRADVKGAVGALENIEEGFPGGHGRPER